MKGLNHYKYGLTDYQMDQLMPKLNEMDRNARAYGWEIGRGAPMIDEMIYSDDNPFINPDWRENVQVNEARDRSSDAETPDS